MKRGIQILLLIVVILLAYMCFISIKKGMNEKEINANPIEKELIEDEDGNF